MLEPNQLNIPKKVSRRWISFFATLLLILLRIATLSTVFYVYQAAKIPWQYNETNDPGWRKREDQGLMDWNGTISSYTFTFPTVGAVTQISIRFRFVLQENWTFFPE